MSPAERIELPAAVDAAEAASRLADAVARSPGTGRRWLRLEQPVRGVDPLRWLQARVARPRTAWLDRSGTRGMVGAGAAWENDAADLARAVVPPLDAELRLLLSVRFAPGRPSAPEWRPFGAVRMLLPRIELRWEPGRAVLACHVDRARAGEAEAVSAALRGDEPAAAAVRARLQPDPGARERWHDAVDEALRRIQDGTLAKIVLARRAHARAAAPVDPVAMLRALADPPSEAFLLAIDRGSDGAFVAVSPELLFRRHGRAVESEALAGTAPRGRDGDADTARGRALLASAKDGREHDLVAEELPRLLAPLCTGLEPAAAPVLRRLPYAWHLLTPVRGTLRGGAGDADLLRALHPTPATCGLPGDEARAAIAELEGFDRGLYSGAVAWLGADESHCAVALRAALVQGSELRLFAGAGIVEGSDPGAEWRETETKLAAFAPVLEPQLERGSAKELPR